jgi:hypothetical protein
MVYEEGKLIKKYFTNFGVFQTKNEKKYVNFLNKINYQSIGDIFNIEVFKRYKCLEFKENKNGLWQLINIRLSYRKDPYNNYYYFFKNNESSEIIIVIDKTFLNNGLFFTNFDLSLLKEYKLINWTPYIQNSSTQCNYQKIKLIKNNSVDYMDRYYAELENKTIIEINGKNIQFPDYYIGQEILAEILPLYQSIDNSILFKYNIPNFYRSDLIIGENINISNINNTIFSIRSYNTLDNQQIAGISDFFISNCNLGKKYNCILNKLFISRKTVLNEKSDYTLVSILDYNGNLLYSFQDSSNYLYIYLIENNPDLSLFLGKKFELDNQNLFLGSDISHNETGNWEFISVIDYIYNFKNISNGTNQSFLINNQETPVSNDIGKKFNLNATDIFFITN